MEGIGGMDAIEIRDASNAHPLREGMRIEAFHFGVALD